jgi:hypothetical protein
MKRYNHAYAIAFSVSGSAHPAGEDLTQEQLVFAILKRIADLVDNNELVEAVGLPHDTYEEDEVPVELQGGAK